MCERVCGGVVLRIRKTKQEQERSQEARMKRVKEEHKKRTNDTDGKTGRI